MTSKTLVAIAASFLLLSQPAFNQPNYLAISTTAMPFLRMNLDARTAGIGDTRIALLNDVNSIFNNASKYLFNSDSVGAAISFRNQSDDYWNGESSDYSYLYASGYFCFNDKNALSGGFRYFNMDEVFQDSIYGQLIFFEAAEYAADLNYSRKLSKNFAAGFGLKYIRSNAPTVQYINGVEIKPSHGIAADLSAIYISTFETRNKKSNISLGLNISNIGNKITYTSSIEKDFIPTNLGLGASYGIELNKYNKLTFAVDINKLLVPTPDTTDNNFNGIPDYREWSVLHGIFKSFSDAPGGIEEEIHEINISTGFEYAFDEQFFVRGGYFYEHATKGGRKYFTTGGGIRYRFLQGDVAYLIPANNPQNPQEPGWTFTLSASI